MRTQIAWGGATEGQFGAALDSVAFRGASGSTSGRKLIWSWNKLSLRASHSRSESADSFWVAALQGGLPDLDAVREPISSRTFTDLDLGSYVPSLGLEGRLRALAWGIRLLKVST